MPTVVNKQEKKEVKKPKVKRKDNVKFSKKLQPYILRLLGIFAIILAILLAYTTYNPEVPLTPEQEANVEEILRTMRESTNYKPFNETVIEILKGF